jgi:hypothetical protein
VGDWYEAALPGRQAFCMRDVAHHAVGAQILGLDTHNKNMIRKFAQNISAARDYCSFWEITKDNTPASVDYTSDNDFWYNLPANFDLLQACWKIFQWTNDRDYIDTYDFNNFYALTVTEYIRAWDNNMDGIPERKEPGSRRGIPSYDERPCYDKALVVSDLIAIQARAFDAYASIHQLKGNNHLYEAYSRKARQLREHFDVNWWDNSNQRFHSALFDNARFDSQSDGLAESGIFPLYYDLIKDGAKADKLLAIIKDCSLEFVEYMTYLPEIFYNYDMNEEAFKHLMKLTDPALERREYPEVAFAVIAAITTGLVGIEPLADQEKVITTARLPKSVTSVKIDHVPVFTGEICVEHIENRITSLINRTGRNITWQAEFAGSTEAILVDGKKAETMFLGSRNSKAFVCVNIQLENGQSARAEVIRVKEV